MKVQGNPFRIQVQQVIVAVTTIAAAVAFLKRPESLKDDEALFRRVMEAQQSVRGNRDGSVAVTWDELRRMVAVSLRVLLEELEK